MCHRQIYWEPLALLDFIVSGKTFLETKSCSSLASVAGTSARTVLSEVTAAVEGTVTLFCVEEVMLTSWQVNTHSVLYQLCFYLFAFVHLFVSLHFTLLLYFFITSIFLLFVSICFLNYLMSSLSLFYLFFYSPKLSALSFLYSSILSALFLFLFFQTICPIFPSILPNYLPYPSLYSSKLSALSFLPFFQTICPILPSVLPNYLSYPSFYSSKLSALSFLLFFQTICPLIRLYHTLI